MHPGRASGHKVLVDGFFLDRPYGFGRYLRELIEALDRHAPAIDFAVAVKPGAAALAAALAPRADIVEGPDWNLLVWEQLAVPRLARKTGAGLIHSPANSRPLLRFGARGVVTLHDLIFDRQRMLDGSVFEIIYRLYCKLCLRVLVRSGDGIVSVSRTTADDLVAQHERASTVIYNSASGFARSVGSGAAQGEYFLHRGGTAPHRNTSLVAKAFIESGLAAQGVELRVFGLGGDSTLARSVKAPGIRLLPRLSEAELAAEYRGAIAVLALSLEEGFGLPIIEAFALGAAVIASDRAPMNEIAGGAALLIDPTDKAAVCSALQHVHDDHDLRRQLIDAGKRRAVDFDHPTIAAQWASIYETASSRMATAATAQPG
jgi:glycosyltransferase involved in cell wall biosynthesis